MPRSHPIFKLRTLLILFLLLLLLGNPVSPATAERDGTEWTTPVNLSQSGAAGDVVVVEDSEGIIHVLWRDEIAGFVYTRSEDEGWATTATVALPFVAELTGQQESAGAVAELFVPQLRADTSGRIHAFWLNEAGTLLYSVVPANTFGELSSWAEAEPLAEGVLAVAIAVGDPGSLHLAYIQTADTEEFPSGVYYRRSDNGGDTWTAVAALEHSAYFRSLPSEQANIQVDTTLIDEAGRVVVAWDMPATEKLFVIQSGDNGDTWQESREVDRRKGEDAETAVGPSNVLVATTGSEVHLLWQAGHQGAICSQYHQWSADGGNSWEAAQPILTDLLVCPDSNKLLVGQNGRLLLLATVEGNVQGGVYLAAWNGERWSELREQEPLASFLNPETLRPVSFDCRQDLVVREQLMAVGCSSGDSRDVWFLTRPLGDMAHWFPAPSTWQVAPLLATAFDEILFPTIVTDLNGWLHIFWVESNSAVINYVRWDGLRWSTSLPVLTSPGGVVDRPVAALTADRRLLVMWNDPESGQIYHSQTDADRALFTEDWISPHPLPVPQAGAASPDVLVAANGVIYVAFAVPVNEGRGIYLTRSTDLGETWSEPVVVFDGVANEWAMVDRPQLTITGNEHLHLLWTRYSSPPAAQPQALAYARSNNGGQRWSEAQMVVRTTLLWSQITGVAENTVHRHWQEMNSGRAMLWQETALDDGQTWSYTSLAASAGEAGRVRLVKDPIGQLHLVYGEGLRLHHRLWDGDRWSQAESLVLQHTDLSQVYSLDAAVTSEGSLAVVYVGRRALKDESEMAREQPFLLQFAQRPLELPLPLAETAMGVAATPQVTPSPLPTAVVGQGEPPENGGPQEGASLLSSLTAEMIVVAALVPAGLFVVLVLVFGVRRSRRVG